MNIPKQPILDQSFASPQTAVPEPIVLAGPKLDTGVVLAEVPSINRQEVFANIFNLFLQQTRPEQDLLDSVMGNAVNGKKSNEDIARQLGVTDKEFELMLNMDFGIEGKGKISNKLTGETYISPSKIGFASFSNWGKAQWGESIGLIIQRIKEALSSGTKDLDSLSLAKEILAKNREYFEAVFNSIIDETQGKGVFSSLVNKVITAINKGAVATLATVSNESKLDSPRVIQQSAFNNSVQAQATIAKMAV